MSNKRTQTYEEEIAELRNAHFDTRLDERVATAAMFNRLLDELKRCYDLIDKFHFVYGDSFEESFWIATCKPDGEGQCSVTVNSYETLMKMVAADVVEIPEYSHDHTELILLECECGVTHEEWLESKN